MSYIHLLMMFRSANLSRDRNQRSLSCSVGHYCKFQPSTPKQQRKEMPAPNQKQGKSNRFNVTTPNARYSMRTTPKNSRFLSIKPILKRSTHQFQNIKDLVVIRTQSVTTEDLTCSKKNEGSPPRVFFSHAIKMRENIIKGAAVGREQKNNKLPNPEQTKKRHNYQMSGFRAPKKRDRSNDHSASKEVQKIFKRIEEMKKLLKDQ